MNEIIFVVSVSFQARSYAKNDSSPLCARGGHRCMRIPRDLADRELAKSLKVVRVKALLAESTFSAEFTNGGKPGVPALMRQKFPRKSHRFFRQPLTWLPQWRDHSLKKLCGR